ncbi:MAG: hypothetical protein OXF31_05285 [Gammaproteobacteria bacterium]|nr:hypothetical protein [Gammaproteobacteria bacterium]MCY4199220.1 hypothetical protein [Gammaproteobacteria bacterium]
MTEKINEIVSTTTRSALREVMWGALPASFLITWGLPRFFVIPCQPTPHDL